jgi:hypothetical protein
LPSRPFSYKKMEKRGGSLRSLGFQRTGELREPMKREQSGKPERRTSADERSGRKAPAVLPPGRKRLFRAIAIFVVPLSVLGGLELVLHLVGFGYDPHFFKRASIAGADAYVANNDFGRRFFPRSQV